VCPTGTPRTSDSSSGSLTAKGVRKDGRRLDINFQEELAPLSDEERRANDELEPAKRRDPDAVHRRIRFIVELVEGRPERGYYDVAANAAGTMFVRYLAPDPPASPEATDFRRIDEREFWTEDQLEFLTEAPVASEPRTAAVRRADGADTMFLACRPDAMALFGADRASVLDTGLPFRLDTIAAALFGADGALAHRRLWLDWAYDAPFPATAGAADVFASPAWGELLERFRAAGGEVVEPGYFTRGEALADGTAVPVSADAGRFALDSAARTLRVRYRAAAATGAVLRLGTGSDFVASFNGVEVARREQAPAHPLPDRDAVLVDLREGDNVLEIRLGDRGPRVAWARLTDAHGLPLR
jgi:hypothetical protein